ncbi:MAG: outer membrane beta-barrel family protein [Bacteroidales bacterium]|nr:outer membrane beta-barrel family protein [Bacteroidales bacterium]
MRWTRLTPSPPIDGREYKVFTWQNASDSHIADASGAVTWQSKVVRLGMDVRFNHTTRKARFEDRVQKASDWRIKVDAAARLGHGWSIGADMNYRSDVVTLHTLIKSYWTLNAGVRKDFRKCSLYLQGRDLLEHKQETSYVSDDEKEMWVEQAFLNRRLIVLGFTWHI